MKKICLGILLFVLSFGVNAQFTIDNSGNWDSPATWSGGVPATTVSDDVTMLDGFDVTVIGTDNLTSGSITTGNTNTIAIQGPSGTLNVGNAGNQRSLTAGNNLAITIQSGGTLIIWGDLDVQSFVGITILPGGQMIIKGNVVLSDFAGLTVDGNLEVDGSFTAGHDTNITVNSGGSISVFGPTTVGANSNVIGAGRFHTYGGCSGPASFCMTAPIQLLFLQAEARTTSVLLSWATASEINFDYFIVERSSAGKNFEEMTTVTASGSPHARTNYSIEDEKPVLGRSYYRLTEVDLDGSVHHLLTAVVDFTGAKSMSIYPNPATTGRITFDLNFVPENKVLVSIVDMRGVMLSEFEIDQNGQTLPVPLAAGIYLVTMRTENFKTVSKLVVK